MADRGQGSDPALPSYDIDGIALVPGFVELVAAGDPLAGEDGEHVGKVKLLAWRGPDFIENAETDAAGVGWILAENWWPYQRPTFVTPPFAGYVSGHSTYSRAAAEVLTRLTGDRFFPGGMSGFEIKAGEFLVFEEGPSADMTLQWATYQDAADQCSLSRIWGGIHPPVDDIPGRIMGIRIGNDALRPRRGVLSRSAVATAYRLDQRPPRNPLIKPFFWREGILPSLAPSGALPPGLPTMRLRPMGKAECLPSQRNPDLTRGSLDGMTYCQAV